ncbi:MAG: hypothetical protein PHI79_08205 [Sulfurovaceae bacterium]|nr:hypothetical protein [Sulfurovaceae bacterium]
MKSKRQKREEARERQDKALCKLTDEKGRTFNKTQWGENVTHTANGLGELCGIGWIHFYDDPVLAVLLNPIHANFNNPILWKIKVYGVIKEDKGLRFGATKVKTIKKIALPIISVEQRVRFAILCSIEVYKEKSFLIWAENWLSGKNRTAQAAYSANAAAAYTAYAAAYAAYAAAAYSANAAAAYAAYATNTAYAAAYAAEEVAAYAAYSANAAAYAAVEVAAYAAVDVAAYAANAAYSANAAAAKNINLSNIAKIAMEVNHD